jgi:glycosyltransferase involved in cell wall biosynthesis
LKLALVSETFPPEINGVAMTLSHLVEGLAARGHRVTVVRPRQGAGDHPSPRLAWSEIVTPGFPIPGYTMLRAGLPAFRRLTREWRSDRPDAVHVATEGPLGWSALRAARALGIPVGSSFHTNFHEYSRHYGAGFLTRPALAYLRWFHNRAAFTLSPTPELNAELERDGFTHVRLLSRGVNTAVFTPEARDPELRLQYGAEPDDLVVVHVSRLAAEKNYGLLLRTWGAIREALPRSVFLIVGDGPLRRRLARTAPWVRFTGFLPRHELARHYASADLFVYASLTETFGNVVTEAMASGLPVAAFHYAAPARFIRSGENGVTVALSQPDALVAAARDLALRPADRRRLGAAARATAETIPWGPVVAGFERDLLSLLPPSPVPVTG